MSILDALKPIEGTTNATTEQTPPEAQTTSETPKTETQAEPAVDTAEPKLFAGKYKTLEELEKGYIELNKLTGAKSAEAAEKAKLAETLESQLKQYVAPADYTIAVEMDEGSKSQLLTVAKAAGWSQSQFDKATETLLDLEEQHAKAFEESTKAVEAEIGPEKLKQMNVFIEDEFKGPLGELLKVSARSNKDIALAVLEKRAAVLNKTNPAGFSKSQLSIDDGQNKMRELAKQMNANPGDVRIRSEFEAVAKAVANLSNNSI